MIRNLKHALPLSLVIALSLANPLDDFPTVHADSGSGSAAKHIPPTKKSEPKPLPWYSSPLEYRNAEQGRESKPAVRSNAATNSTRPVANADNAKKIPGAQSIPSAVPPSRGPALRQVAGPGSQYSQTQNSQTRQPQSQAGNSSIQQQLDALYREKGLDAPQMSYDALPVQGPDDYAAMQESQPQQGTAIPRNQQLGGNQQAVGQQPSSQNSPSWIQRIFGRRSKTQEPAPQPQGTNLPNQLRMNQGQPNQAGQPQNFLNQSGQAQSPQYQVNQNQGQQQQFYQNDQTQQGLQTENREAEYPQSTPSQQPSGRSSPQSRSAQSNRRPSTGQDGYDYSQLRQSRTVQKPTQQQFNSEIESSEEPEESLEIQSSTTPRLETSQQEPEQTTTPSENAPEETQQPSPFDNLELHTPEDPSAPADNSGRTPVEQDAQQPREDDAKIPAAQPGMKPSIIPGNEPTVPGARPIIETDDAELEAKYRILAAFPELEGLKGFCPVALRNDRELIRGKRLYAVIHNDREYQLSSTEAMIKFRQDPEKYLPVVEGKDTVQLEAGDSRVGTLDYGAWYRGRLYLFANLDNLETFVSSPSTYEQIALGGTVEEEESLEMDDESSPKQNSTGDQVDSSMQIEEGTSGNRSPADALRGFSNPPAQDRSQEKISVPPPPEADDEEEDEVEMPGNRRPTAKLSSRADFRKTTSFKLTNR